MWRRACLGDRDAVVALGYLWFGISVAVLLVAAAREGWGIAALLGAGVAALLQTVYWLRRRRWDRMIRVQGLEGIAAVEVLLKHRSQG